MYIHFFFLIQYFSDSASFEWKEPDLISLDIICRWINKIKRKMFKSRLSKSELWSCSRSRKGWMIRIIEKDDKTGQWNVQPTCPNFPLTNRLSIPIKQGPLLRNSQFGVYCAVYSTQCAVYSVQCAVFSVHSVQCAVCSVQCTVYSVQCAVCSVQYTVCIVQCTVFSVQCAVYSTHCAVWSVQYTLCMAKCWVCRVE